MKLIKSSQTLESKNLERTPKTQIAKKDELYNKEKILKNNSCHLNFLLSKMQI